MMEDKIDPADKGAVETPATAEMLTDEAVEAAAGGGTYRERLGGLFMKVQQGLWADNPDVLRDIMDRHGAKSSAPPRNPGSAGKDV